MSKKTQDKRRKHKRVTHRNKKNGGNQAKFDGGNQTKQFDNFEELGKSIDDFFVLFDMDKLSKKEAKEYLGYKTYNRKSKLQFVLLPSTTKNNQFSNLKIIKQVESDPGVTLMDEINYQIHRVDDDLGELVNGYYNITQDNVRPKGTYIKEVMIEEPLRDNLPAVDEPNISRFAAKRFK
jgi:hypothetical protein